MKKKYYLLLRILKCIQFQFLKLEFFPSLMKVDLKLTLVKPLFPEIVLEQKVSLYSLLIS